MEVPLRDSIGSSGHRLQYRMRSTVNGRRNTVLGLEVVVFLAHNSLKSLMKKYRVSRGCPRKTMSRQVLTCLDVAKFFLLAWYLKYLII